MACDLIASLVQVLFGNRFVGKAFSDGGPGNDVSFLPAWMILFRRTVVFELMISFQLVNGLVDVAHIMVHDTIV